MLEARGNLWTFSDCDIAVTTNGFVKRDGTCVMGRGCAQEAKRMWPELPSLLGRAIRDQGNNVHRFELPSFRDESAKQVIWSFPVKHNWWELADLDLICHSASQLSKLAGNTKVLIPRPGCGNGGLSWFIVKPAISHLLGDNFTVITF